MTRQIELERAKAYIEEHVRYTYACPHCRDGGQMVTTSKPPVPLEKSPFGASVLAWIIAAKHERHLPTYRHQEMLLEPLGLWLSRPLLARLLQGSARVLRPLAECGLREILRSYVTQADETPVKYLGGEPGKASTGYLFGYGGDAEHRFLYYDYRASRCRAGPAEVLANYQGVLLTDGFSGYESVVCESQGRLRAAACWMHARREFDEARATTSHPLVEETLAHIRQLYDVEDRAKLFTPDERRALASGNHVMSWNESSRGWTRIAPNCAPPPNWPRPCSIHSTVTWNYYGSSKTVASNSTRACWNARCAARLWVEKTSCSSAVSPAAAPPPPCTPWSSAKLYHLDVTAYLTDVLRRLPAILPTDESALRELLPDRWATSHPNHVLQARQQESLAALEHRRHRRLLRRLEMTA